MKRALILAILVLALVACAPVHAEPSLSCVDTNGNGIIDQSEVISVIAAYFNGLSVPTQPPTEPATEPPVPTPDGLDYVERLDCQGRSPPGLSVDQVSRHIDVDIAYTGEVVHGKVGFRIVEDYKCCDITNGWYDIKGFELLVTGQGEWLYQRTGTDISNSRSVMLGTGWLSDAGIPFTTGEGAQNRLTFLTRTDEYDGYQFFVNGHRVPVEFTGIDDILSTPHKRYHAGRRYSISIPYYESQITKAKNICMVNSWE